MITPETTKAKKVFDQLVTEGVDLDELVQAAASYKIRVKTAGEPMMPLADWLSARGWEQHRH